MPAELSSGDPAGRQFALEMLQRTAIGDPAIVDAVTAINKWDAYSSSNSSVLRPPRTTVLGIFRSSVASLPP